MSAKTLLRLTSLLMFLAAVIFVSFAVSVPTWGRVIYFGDFEFGPEQWRICYVVYAIVMVFLFVLSFFFKKGGTARETDQTV